MNYELSVNLGNRMTTVFLQNGFYNLGVSGAHMHKHSYTELHVVLNGSVSFYINGRVCEVKSGSVIAIPAGYVHECVSHKGDVLHTAFQISEPVFDVKICSVPPEMLKLLFQEIVVLKDSDDYTSISMLLSFLCVELYPEAKIAAREVENSSFIIGEFFSNNYSADITLSSLAKELHLSEKQTERLVVKCMGCNFKKALTAVRMSTAEQLIKEGKLTLAEIAEYVGYRSYSGFWKAYSRYKSRNTNRVP